MLAQGLYSHTQRARLARPSTARSPANVSAATIPPASANSTATVISEFQLSPPYSVCDRSDKLNYYVKKMTFILIINRVE
ncbi:hypothetical protein PEC302110_26960 [Pectobacterium araliae]|uniref:Uncharacterized protein n=1 Tax=Pectobacterium araliae TaxID=3073862 RepID=A0AAN0KHL0_9GAMM|nr:hypothetical protein PEC302110_26960 [Pectobacterium sp. MAFF 302110]